MKQTIDIKTIFENAAKDAENTSVVMTGRAAAFRDMAKFFADNHLEVVQEVPDPKPEVTPGTEGEATPEAGEPKE